MNSTGESIDQNATLCVLYSSWLEQSVHAQRFGGGGIVVSEYAVWNVRDLKLADPGF